QKAIEGGQPVSDWLIRSLHHELLNFGRGAHKSPGQYKTEQNYLVDPIKKRILFTPIKPERLRDGLDQLFLFSANDAHAPLLRSAIAHVEFEALHPFEDGNGRVGRMLITLGLWKDNLISKPYFYISRFFENNKDEYIDRMRMVSEKNDWTQWCEFFLTGVETQAISNLDLAEKIQDLYQQTQIVFSEALASKWSFQALDFIYAHPIFRTTQLVRDTDVAPATARRFINILLEKQQLVCLVPPSGRRAGLYGFEPLLKLVRV
ncbi:MAG: Fic family protein, partial [Pseudomonadota bacterium]